MQKLIAKYGLAAHLAILAVAPFFLFPFVRETTCATVLIWLSLPVCLWVLLEPSVRFGEHLHDARRRVLRAILRDPLFWVSVALVLFTGIRALNTGVALVYDAETSHWRVSEANLPLIPGAVGSAGYLPFAAALAFTVLIQGCRHALGRSARMACLLFVSSLAGVAAVIAVFSLPYGCAGALSALEAEGDPWSFVGLAFGLAMLGGVIALVAAIEQHWNFALFLVTFAIGGNGAAFFAFSPVYLFVGLAGVELALLAYVLFFVHSTLRSSGAAKLLTVFGIALVLGGLLVAAVVPESAQLVRIRAIKSAWLFPKQFWAQRAVLSGVAFKSWVPCLWTGTGLGSFAFDFRFNVQPEDWVMFPRGSSSVPNGWWQALAERGLVGVVFIALPFCFLLFTYIRRMVRGLRAWELPHPACLLGFLVLALVVAEGFFDCSPIRADVLLVTGSLMSISASSFPRKRGQGNG